MAISTSCTALASLYCSSVIAAVRLTNVITVHLCAVCVLHYYRRLILSVLSVACAVALTAAAVLCPAVAGAVLLGCASCAVGIPGIYSTVKAAKNIMALNKASQACTDLASAVQAGGRLACDVADTLKQWKDKVETLKVKLQGVVSGVSTITDGVADAQKVLAQLQSYVTATTKHSVDTKCCIMHGVRVPQYFLAFSTACTTLVHCTVMRSGQ